MDRVSWENDLVILIHGLGGNRIDMWPIGRRLKSLGFEVCNWGYRSIGNRIETHANRLAEFLSKIDRQVTGQIHVVTHSMGGIIARATFADQLFNNVGRVVMLAPPNRGSHVARKLTRYLGWLTPSLEQLSDSPGSYVNQLPNTLYGSGIEFAIVESSKDRVIAPGGVHLDGHSDYARVDGHHGVLTWYSDTIRLVENFLILGQFQVPTTIIESKQESVISGFRSDSPAFRGAS